MAERRSTRIKKPTAKARRASKSPTRATRHPPTPPLTPGTPSTPKSILKRQPARKRSPAKVPKRVTVFTPLPPPSRSLPLQPPRPSEWPSAYLWTPLPQTPLTPLSLNLSARRAKFLHQLLKQRYDFHLHALRPAKEKVIIYQNSVNVLQQELWKLEDWRVESLYDLGVSERRLRNIGGTRGLDSRIRKSHRWVEEAEGELERAERVLRVAERRLGDMEGEWYELLFASRDEEGREEVLAAGEEWSDSGDDADIDAVLALMNLPLAATIQLGSNLEHRAYVDDLSNQLQATRTKMGQLQRELEAAREEVGILFPQPSPFEFQRRRGTNSSKRGTSDPREHGADDADDEEQKRKERISYPRVARLVGALVAIRERERELEVLLLNAEEHERHLDAELCKRAVMGIDGSMRSPASTIGTLSPSTPLTPR